MNYRRRWKRANSRSTGSKCVLPNGMTGPKPTTHSSTTTNPFVALEIGIGESTSKRLLTRPANKKNVVIVIDIQGAPSPANPKFHAIRPQARTTSKASTWSRSTRPLSEGTNTARIPLWATLRWVFISVMPMLMLCKSIRVIYYFHLAAVAVAVAVAVAARMASLSPHPFQLVSPMVGSCHHCRGSASMRFPVPVNELLAALQKTVTLVLPHYRAQKKALELKKRMSKRRVQ